MDFYEMPLWPHGNLPEGWNQLLAVWEESLTQVNLSEIYERHIGMIHGGPISWEDMENRLQEWVDSLSQADMASNPLSTDLNRTAKVPADDVNDDEGSNAPASSSQSQKSADSKHAPAKSREPQSPEASPASPGKSILGTALPLTDSVASTDVLGRESLVSAIGAMLASPRQSSPLTLGIFGNWGSGKSSVIHQIKSRLSSAPYEGQFDFASFNPWENRHAASIQAEMVKALVRGLTEKLSRPSRLKLMWEFIRKEPRQSLYKNLIGLAFYLVASLALGIIALALSNTLIHAAYGITFLTGLGLFVWRFWHHLKPAFEQSLPFPVSLRVDLPEKDDPQTVSSSEWKSQLSTLCQLRLKSDNVNRPRRLIFTIDDIDRCPSEVILETFDSIQLLADLPGVMTIIATDERVALQAIADQYANVEDRERSASMLGREYLGKLMQASMALSNPSRATVRKFVEKWLFPELNEPSGKVEIQPVPRVTPSHTASTAGGDSSSLYNKVVEDPTLPLDAQNITIEQVLQMDMRDTNRDKAMFIDLADLFEFSNPRQLIRLRNSFRLAKAFNRIRRYDNELKEFGLSKIMTLLFWEEFLRTQPSQIRQFSHLAIYSNDAIDRTSLPSPLVDGINRIRDVFDLSMADDDSTKRSQFKELNEFVNQFLLPYITETESRKSNARQESEESVHAADEEEDSHQDAVQRTVRLMTRG
ncbi:MAG: KAP family NTPase [Verrucomicrobia bacterium]|nr:KAP family NTPase [Verrucomicrobiota bacterium]